ncbi:CD209 antigen-like protein E [Mytilus trossulus]|uniref:CD209 antigen-like protein E n=1 Tax=Mytilus trossulus TaxID=6551 RepID=UPI003005E8DB
MKRILVIGVLIIAFAAANEKRFTNSSNDGKTNPLLWMILNQISGFDTKISKLQDKNEQVNKEISELKLKQKETDNNAGKIKTINSKISEIRKFQNHDGNSVYEKAISKMKADIRNLQSKHSNDDRRTKQILKMKGDVKDLQAKHMQDDKREKQLQEFNQRLKALRNDVDILKKKDRQSCESGWKLFGNHCYFFGLQKASWHVSKRECESRHSYLVKIETKTENSFLYSTLTAYWKHETFWIGLNDLTTEGKFTWISDHSSVAYKGWDPTNPSNSGGNEDCTEIHDVHWNDNNCSRRYNFICEKQIG